MAMCQISCWTLRHNDPQVKNNQESIQIYTTQINTCDLIYDHQLFKKTVQISHTCSNFLSVHNCNVFVSSFSLHNVSLYLVTVKQRARRLPVANIINKVPVICAREKKLKTNWIFTQSNNEQNIQSYDRQRSRMAIHGGLVSKQSSYYICTDCSRYFLSPALSLRVHWTVHNPHYRQIRGIT